ncbi:MAG: hypothetical protein HWN66_00800 [Candidatus Helarchaeota archaeon]|nr:hypothetical protein [Candidatus Helarchaeota archaeon]
MSGFKVGFSDIIITPKLHLPMGGYGARLCNATGVHDDLFARAVYFNYNNGESLIIAADILSFPLKAIKYYRKLINHQIGIEEQRIFICALHNHSGPDTMGLIHPLRGFFRSSLDVRYFLKLGKKFVKLAENAKMSSQEALVDAEKRVMEKRLIINRREPLRDSKYDVGVIRFDDLQGNIIGFIINYACHGTVLPSDNTLYTAEYPGYLIKRIKARLGKKIHVIYLNGPCGDLNPNLFDFNVSLAEVDAKKEILYDGPGHAKGNFKRAREIGFAIADKALDISEEMKCIPITDFNHTFKSYFLSRKYLLYEKTVKMHLRHLNFKFKVGRFKLFWCIKKPPIPYPIDFIRKDGKYLQEAEIHVLKLNDIAIVGIPGEVFSELGNRILAKSKVKKTIIAELANGSIGYLYPLEDYKKGGYEMFLSLDVTGGTYLTNKAIKLLNSM